MFWQGLLGARVTRSRPVVGSQQNETPQPALNAAFMLLIVLHAGVSQSRNVTLPTVADAKVPLYPPLARAVRVQGVVRVRITTDGHRVVSAAAESGPRILAAAAEDSAHSWQFTTH